MQTKKYNYPRVLISKTGNTYDSKWKVPRRFWRHKQTTVIGPSWAALRKVTRITWEHRTNLFRYPLFRVIYTVYSVYIQWTRHTHLQKLLWSHVLKLLRSTAWAALRHNSRISNKLKDNTMSSQRINTITCTDTVANAFKWY